MPLSRRTVITIAALSIGALLPTVVLLCGMRGMLREQDRLIAGIKSHNHAETPFHGQVVQALTSTQEASSAWFRRTGIGAVLLALAAAGLIAAIQIRQDRQTAGMLLRLRHALRRIGCGHFREPAQLGSNPQYRPLAGELNKMSQRLDALYADLERQVLARSRELVRSERLASVGFLAAGVAHEINNPLNIITGYAELALHHADRLAESQSSADIRQAFQIIREEGFRCKAITEKLVALASASRMDRETVSIARIAKDVVALVQDLKQFRDRRIRLALCPTGSPLSVWGNESELKQVVLGLAINALHAVSSGTGEVIIQGTQDQRGVRLSVIDNGRGMSPEVLERVFEPFFSQRRPDGERGVGLGLSITHAIVEAHGGRITAESDGPNRGSRFTLQLPACEDIQTRDGKAA